MASGPKRTAGLVKLLDKQAVDVVGLQEFQRIQKRTFLRLAGNRYAVYSPPGDTDNSIAWRRDRWEMTGAGASKIPYFNGHPRRMPIVELRSRGTGQSIIVFNVHNPADTRRYPRQGRWRAEALRREVRVVRRLIATEEAPVFLVGDFNERRRTFCYVTGRGSMSASAGGSHRRQCQPPRSAQIDWIFGSQGIAFGANVVDRSGLVSRSSDHPLVVARISR